MIHADLLFFASHFYSHTDRHNTAHSDIIENTATEFGGSSITQVGYSVSMGYPLSLFTANIMQEHKVPYDNYSVKDPYTVITSKLSALKYSSA